MWQNSWLVYVLHMLHCAGNHSSFIHPMKWILVKAWLNVEANSDVNVVSWHHDRELEVTKMAVWKSKHCFSWSPVFCCARYILKDCRILSWGWIDTCRIGLCVDRIALLTFWMLFFFWFQSNDILGAILEGYPKTKKQLYVSINCM